MLGSMTARVIESAATRGHIAYHLPAHDVAFVGDTLFALGCGRLFEGTAAQMWASLSRLNALPPETRPLLRSRVYRVQRPFRASCSTRPRRLQAHAEVSRRAAAKVPTVPTNGLEQAANPFLRASCHARRTATSLVLATFGKLRRGRA